MNFEEMRKYVISSYPGKTWTNKVMNMDHRQVIAIYYKLIKINKRNKNSCFNNEYQITIDDFLKGGISC